MVGFRLPAVPNWFKVLVTWPQRSCSDAKSKKEGHSNKTRRRLHLNEEARER